MLNIIIYLHKQLLKIPMNHAGNQFPTSFAAYLYPPTLSLNQESIIHVHVVRWCCYCVSTSAVGLLKIKQPSSVLPAKYIDVFELKILCCLCKYFPPKNLLLHANTTKLIKEHFPYPYVNEPLSVLEVNLLRDESDKHSQKN